MKYLGIDYGKRKIGLALSEGIMATPFGVIHVSSLEDALNKIGVVIKRENIDKVVIGKPESGEAANMVDNFLKAFNSVPSVIVDETLSTKAVAGKGKKEDSYSAAIILQNYLDEKS